MEAGVCTWVCPESVSPFPQVDVNQSSNATTRAEETTKMLRTDLAAVKSALAAAHEKSADASQRNMAMKRAEERQAN